MKACGVSLSLSQCMSACASVHVCMCVCAVVRDASEAERQMADYVASH